MGKIVNAYILPHPPVVVQGVGRGRERSAYTTVEAMKRAAREIGKDRPTTIILSTPHAPCFKDYVYVYDQETLSGDFSDFGSPEIELSFKNNTVLAELIAEKASKSSIGAGGLSTILKKQYGISNRLDHGALVPLWFIQKELPDFKLVCISTPFLPFEELYEFGRRIQEAVAESDERVVYIASGDLSHKLNKDAPAGFHPQGKEYDEYLVGKVRSNDYKGLLETEENFLENAGECGTRSVIIMYGALKGMNLTSEVYSYEGPFGVGYLIARVSPSDRIVGDRMPSERGSGGYGNSYVYPGGAKAAELGRNSSDRQSSGRNDPRSRRSLSGRRYTGRGVSGGEISNSRETERQAEEERRPANVQSADPYSELYGGMELKNSDYVKLAREALETYIRDGKKIRVPDWVRSEMKMKRAGAFVSIKKRGALRGCMGTVGPTMVNVAEEIINNAINSGFRDPRFPAVKEEELKELVYSVDVLGAPQKINSLEELDVKRYGVIVTNGFRRGLLLPDLEGVDTPEKQVTIALQKAGIMSSESFDLERFEVIRYL
ncbi:AmmeMemoRadiSam system protein A [Anoxybacterium hadale]|uniref:AmmeMemoRadiSam system protein A n=1 Tax=Anoxybacterium hadale TaxID=3408580 RepID=A0ACD1AAK9_9FIRM|nr:AmmeMemoRadiSam system protein A [Clostridiales bacterium]